MGPVIVILPDVARPLIWVAVGSCMVILPDVDSADRLPLMVGLVRFILPEEVLAVKSPDVVWVFVAVTFPLDAVMRVVAAVVSVRVILPDEADAVSADSAVKLLAVMLPELVFRSMLRAAMWLASSLPEEALAVMSPDWAVSLSRDMLPLEDLTSMVSAVKFSAWMRPLEARMFVSAARRLPLLPRISILPLDVEIFAVENGSSRCRGMYTVSMPRLDELVPNRPKFTFGCWVISRRIPFWLNSKSGHTQRPLDWPVYVTRKLGLLWVCNTRRLLVKLMLRWTPAWSKLMPSAGMLAPCGDDMA